jgi:hypothetical protein
VDPDPRAVWVDETQRRGLLQTVGHTMDSITMEKDTLELIRARYACVLVPKRSERHLMLCACAADVRLKKRCTRLECKPALDDVCCIGCSFVGQVRPEFYKKIVLSTETVYFGVLLSALKHSQLGPLTKSVLHPTSNQPTNRLREMKSSPLPDTDCSPRVRNQAHMQTPYYKP